MKLLKHLNKNKIEYKSDKYNLTVGGSLDLEGTQISELPDNLTVGGFLDLRGTQISEYVANNVNRDIKLISWKGGKYVLIDSMFTEVVKNKGNVYHVKNIGSKNIFYVVTDGNGKYSHGSTIEEARNDLIYKISNRSKEEFKSLNLNSVLSLSEMIECYRVITGACSFGTKRFVESLSKVKENYSISEIIDLTNGKFGNNEFSSFFNLSEV